MAYKKLIKVSNVCQVLDKRTFPASGTNNGITFTHNGDGSYTVNGTFASSRGSYFYFCNYENKNIIKLFANHKYLVLNGTYYEAGLFSVWLVNDKNSLVAESNANLLGNYDTSKMYTPNRDLEAGLSMDINHKNNVDTVNFVFKPQLFDLTEMYGAGHEPTTVEQFRQDFPEEMYDYSPHCWLTSYKRVIVTGNETYPTLTTYQRNLTCKTKNLFDIPLTRGYPSDTTRVNTTLRTFTFGTYIVGMSGNNYYWPPNIFNFAVDKNKIYINLRLNAYGVSVPYSLTVGKTYTASCKVDNNFYPAIGISYYKEDGTLISYTQTEEITNNPIVSFTVPENTYYTLILFYGRQNNEYTFSNIQLELGDTATDYVPYGHL